MRCVEYRDVVAAHVDDQLTTEEGALAMAHVASCASCARLLDTQRVFKQTFRDRRFLQPTPDAVRQAITARIEVEESARQPRSWWRTWWSLPVARLALAGAAVLLVVLVAVPWLRPRPHAPASALFDTIVTRYHAAEKERIELSMRTDDPTELRGFYLKSGDFTFTNTVVDLEPLGFVLVGGSVTELAGKKSTLSVYRGAKGMVLCHRIDAAGVKLPPGGEVVGGDRFYTVDGITICIHREGDVVCFMTSAMPHADFVRLLGGHV